MTRGGSDAMDGQPSYQTEAHRVFFTIVSANYISYAATLMQSVRREHPTARRVIVLADAPRAFDGLDLAAELIFCGDLGIEMLSNMTFWYSVIEFNTAIKPYAFIWLLDNGAEAVCYLDPDIYLYQPISEAFDALADHEAVLTPHLLEPLRDRKEPSDLTIMKSGVYNLGFFAVRDTPSVRTLLSWWADRNFTHCRVDIPGNMFTDQRWMDMAPCFITGLIILRHPGYNVAYWNLAHRSVRRTADGWRVNEDALVFFHFSGLDPHNPSSFSKHQNRFAYDNLREVGTLVDDYRNCVLANGWNRFRRLAYSFGSFTDGRTIEDTMRRWLLRGIDDALIEPRKPLVIPSSFFDMPDPTAADRGATLSRFMYQFWLDRADLRTAFDISQPTGLAKYYAWFSSDAVAQGVSPLSAAAAGLSEVGAVQQRGLPSLRRHGVTDTVPPIYSADSVTASSATSSSVKAPSPWPALSSRCWRGPAQKVEHYLSQDVRIGGDAFRLPRTLALLWERRADLRQHFKLDNVISLNQYLAWGLSDGILQNAVDPTLLSADFIAQSAEVSHLSGHYDDVPITRAMLIAQHISHSRNLLGASRRFPVEAKGRLAHGMWFAYVAARCFRWPTAMVVPVRTYFDQLSSVSVDGLQLTRGTLAIWELHSALQQSFPLTDPPSCLRYLRWLIFDGIPQLDLSLDDLDPRLRYFLALRTPRIPSLSRTCEMVHGLRQDLRERFDLESADDRTALTAWVDGSLDTAYPHLAAVSAVRASTAMLAVTASADRAAVALTGLWQSASGRGEDIRCSAKALEAAGFHDYRIVDLVSGDILYPDGCKSPTARLEVDFNICHVNADTAVEDWARLRALGVDAGRTIGFWAWELERLPVVWWHAFSFYDEIWASTRFAYRAFRAPRMRPVRLVPMAVLETKTAPVSRVAWNIPAFQTMFLFMFDFRSHIARKNPQAVIAAFAKAFPNRDEPVCLVIKTIGAEAEPTARDALESVVAGDSRIRLINATLDRAEVLGLVAAADAFVSLHRSEGFGRGPAEAMLLGVPVIVTAYSGTADFATANVALPVGYIPVAVDPNEYPGADGQCWADPDIVSAASHMRLIHDDPQRAKLIGARGRAQICSLYNPRRVGQRMLSVLGLTSTRTDLIEHLLVQL